MESRDSKLEAMGATIAHIPEISLWSQSVDFAGTTYYLDVVNTIEIGRQKLITNLYGKVSMPIEEFLSAIMIDQDCLPSILLMDGVIMHRNGRIQSQKE
jgi:hypothetical protein